MIDREAIVADAVNGETDRSIALGRNAPVRLDATQLTSTQRIREVIDQLRGIEPPKLAARAPRRLRFAVELPAAGRCDIIRAKAQGGGP